MKEFVNEGHQPIIELSQEDFFDKNPRSKTIVYETLRGKLFLCIISLIVLIKVFFEFFEFFVV